MTCNLCSHVYICFIQFARNFYIAQWYRDNTVEVEKAIKTQNENDEDSKGWRRSKNVDPSEEIAQIAEARKKFLRKIIKTTPSNFCSLKLVLHFGEEILMVLIPVLKCLYVYLLPGGIQTR